MANSAKTRHISDTIPLVEVDGPHSNQFRIYVGDMDGDWIALTAREARALTDRLIQALAFVSQQRQEAKRKKVLKVA